MRFTPVTHFASGLVEPCVGALASGSVSSSVNLGGVIWDIFVYSASQQEGGAQDTPSQESYTFQMTGGTTKRAIVGVIGGGGSGAGSAGNGLGAAGGGGGVNLVQELTLAEEATYSVYVGYGANGTSRVTSAGADVDGEDGAPSSFSENGGSFTITAGGGEGGFSLSNGNVGGISGTPTSNTTTTLAGAGAGASPQAIPGTSNLNNGGNGVSIWLGDGVQLRAGGGGNNPSGSSTLAGGYLYGGGDDAGVWCFDDSGAGSGGSLRTAGGSGTPNTLTFGGGGAGGQHFCSADNTYRTSKGGAGAVFIAIPTNLCSGSLFAIKPIVYDSLISYFEMGNPKVVGKLVMGQEVNNLISSGDVLNHVNDLSNIASGSEQLYTNYTSSICSMGSVATSSIQSDTNFNGTPGYDFYSGSVQGLDTTEAFSVEFIGRDTGTAQIDFWSMKNAANVADSITLGAQQRFYVNTSGGGSVYLQGSYTEADINQHVITYDGSATVKWYVNGSLNVQNFTAPIPSGITNPILQISEEAGFTADMEIQAFRVYTKALTLSEVQTNYATVVFPPIPPTPNEACVCTTVSFTAGGTGGTAVHYPCGVEEVSYDTDVYATNTTVTANTTIDICIVSGSYKAMTGSGAGISVGGTCTSSLPLCNP